MSQKFYDVDVKLVDSTFTTNRARSHGSNIYIRLMITETNSSIGIHNSHISHGKSNSDSAPDTIPYSLLIFLHGLYETSLGNNKIALTVLATVPQILTYTQLLIINQQKILADKFF